MKLALAVLATRSGIAAFISVKGPMRVTKQQMIGFLGVASVIIALFLTPSIAQAHSGHGLSQAASSTSAPVPKEAGEQLTTRKVVPQEITAKQDTPDKNASGCLGQCCASASHACCAFMLPQGLNDDGPAWLVSRDRVASTPDGRGLTPKALRKPPKSFA